jgi:hypothetical protein
MARRSHKPDNALADRLLIELHASPGAKAADLAMKLHADHITTRSTLVDLEEAGHVRRAGATRGTRWFVTGAAAPEEPASTISDTDSKTGEPKPSARPKRDAEAASRAATGKRRGRKSRLDQYEHLMGKVPDGEIATMAGVSRPAVAQYRYRRGIAGPPRKHENGLPPEADSRTGRPAPRPESPPSPPGPVAAQVARTAQAPRGHGDTREEAVTGMPNKVWAVKVRAPQDEPFFVVAPTLAAAALRARGALGDEAVGVELAGRVVE